MDSKAVFVILNFFALCHSYSSHSFKFIEQPGWKRILVQEGGSISLEYKANENLPEWACVFKLKTDIRSGLGKEVCYFSWVQSTGELIKDPMCDPRVTFVEPEKAVSFAECGITLNNVTLQDAGKWICDIVTYHENALLSGAVKRYSSNPTPVEVYPHIFTPIQQPGWDRILVQEGGSITLKFKASGNLPEWACVFRLRAESGSNLSKEVCYYNQVWHSEKVWYPKCDPRVTFLESGNLKRSAECGITLNNVTLQDAGNWICDIITNRNSTWKRGPIKRFSSNPTTVEVIPRYEDLMSTRSNAKSSMTTTISPAITSTSRPTTSESASGFIACKNCFHIIAIVLCVVVSIFLIIFFVDLYCWKLR